MTVDDGEMPAAPAPAAYCTMVTNDAYVTPALVVARSLRNTQTHHPLFILTTSSVTAAAKSQLLTLYDRVIPVPDVPVASGTRANLALIGRPDLHATLTKVQLWSLERYVRRVLYLDADTLVLRNLDHLFELPQLSEGIYDFAAAPELGYPDTFNAGLMLLTPKRETHDALLKFALVHESYDGGDQGLLNVFFGDGTRGLERKLRMGSGSGKKRKGGVDGEHGVRAAPAVRGPPSPEEERGSEDGDVEVSGEDEESAVQRDWFRLPFTYNMEMHRVFRLNIPAVLRYREEHNVLHFIGKDKPWHFGPDGDVPAPPEGSSPYFEFYSEMVRRWWAVRREVDA